jgi:hypothetical protein
MRRSGVKVGGGGERWREVEERGERHGFDVIGKGRNQGANGYES